MYLDAQSNRLNDNLAGKSRKVAVILVEITQQTENRPCANLVSEKPYQEPHRHGFRYGSCTRSLCRGDSSPGWTERDGRDREMALIQET
jgi:hypothetical protein